MRWMVEESRLLASHLHTADSNRWMHVQSVAAAAQNIVDETGLTDVVVSAAWLHDIGYTRAVTRTGLHALDGARYLAAHGAPAELVSLVAYHSGAEFEADERGLLDMLHEFLRPYQANLDALMLADMTRDSTGASVTVEQRLAGILSRYPQTHPVHRAVSRSAPYLTTCTERAKHRPTVNQ